MDGRRTHIFNPPLFPLAVFSLALIITGTSDVTWGQNFAPRLEDLPIVLRGSKGRIADRSPAALYALACRTALAERVRRERG